MDGSEGGLTINVDGSTIDVDGHIGDDNDDVGDPRLATETKMMSVRSHEYIYIVLSFSQYRRQ